MLVVPRGATLDLVVKFPVELTAMPKLQPLCDITSFKSISLIGLVSCKDYYNRPIGEVGYVGRAIKVGVFYVGQCVLRERVVGGSGSYGYFREQGLPGLSLRISPRIC